MKKLLIVQVRPNPVIRDHDASAFRRVIDGSIAYDLKNVTEHSIALPHIEEYAGYIVGGSHYMTYEDFPQRDELYKLTRFAIDTGRPFLGVCFGFEVLSEVLGAKVVHDAFRKEFGTYTATLTHDGAPDPLCAGLTREFLVQEAHESYVPELPSGCTLLMSGEHIPIQGIRCRGTPIYGLQFHPELSKENMHERMELYNNDATTTFAFTKEDFERIKDTKPSEKIITNFVAMI